MNSTGALGAGMPMQMRTGTGKHVIVDGTVEVFEPPHRFVHTHRDLPAHARLKVQPPGSMCNATKRITSAPEVDTLLKGWLRQAYDAAS